MNLSTKQLAIIGGVVLLLVIGVLVFTLGKQASTVGAPQLTVWGVDKSDSFNAISGLFAKAVRGAKITYVQKPEANYEENLIKALAAGVGPDVFYISNRSLPKMKDVLVPVDSTKFTTTNLTNLFPTAAGQDFVYKGSIYALPLNIDALVMFYNRDIFDRAAVANPPVTWEEFQADVPKLRVLNDKGQITTAAAAIGGSNKTVAYASDILSLLMLQNGVSMPSSASPEARFSDAKGVAALDFYTQFTNPASQAYTWNESETASLDNFSAGGVAVVFGYRSDAELINRKNQFLKYGVAPVPQLSAGSSVNYPKYWGLAVSKQSANYSGAWDFIQFATTNTEALNAYAAATNNLPALKTYINYNLNDKDYGVLANEALSARSWWIPDAGQVDGILNSAILRVISGVANVSQSLREAQDGVNQIR
ncbi:MAG: extracellular solute-binding protein [Sedimentisphaerales bacterium]|nr:extracellular solute-binding protein [Sedimentisphaerales bacterium]